MAKVTMEGEIEADDGANNVTRVLKEITDRTGYSFSFKNSGEASLMIDLQGDRLIISAEAKED